MKLNSIVDENTIVFESTCTILSIIPKAIIHNKELKWQKAEENYLTLKEIKEQLNGLPIRVISDSALWGYIYEYGNYNDVYFLLNTMIRATEGEERQKWIKKMLEHREKCPELKDLIEPFLQEVFKRSYPSEMSEL